MNETLLKLYRVTWGHTAATYIAASTNNLNIITKMVRESDERCDDIKCVEKVFLPSFDGDTKRGAEYISVFCNFPII